MLRDGDDTDEGRARHREQTKSAIKRAWTRLIAMDVVRCEAPFVWWTGEPVNGIIKTHNNATRPA